jgi:hypothetical protein
MLEMADNEMSQTSSILEYFWNSWALLDSIFAIRNALELGFRASRGSGNRRRWTGRLLLWWSSCDRRRFSVYSSYPLHYIQIVVLVPQDVRVPFLTLGLTSEHLSSRWPCGEPAQFDHGSKPDADFFNSRVLAAPEWNQTHWQQSG